MTYASNSGFAAAPTAIRRIGTVKFWKADKGFGFIVPDDPGLNGGSDVFVHVSATAGQAMEKGTRVSFELGMDKRSGKVAAREVKLEQ